MLRPFATSSRFTLIELIIVMLLLATIMAMVVPRLSGFFQGHAVEDEARRVWALSQYANGQAAARAVPMVLWIDVDGDDRHYGVEALAGYGETVQALTYPLPAALSVTALGTVGNTGRVAAAVPVDGRLSLTWWPDGSAASDNAMAWRLSDSGTPGDDWFLVRQSPRSSYILQREWTP